MSSTLFIQTSNPDRHPLMQLPDEDLDLVVRFVVHSGSLKDLSKECDASYPTIRARLDRVIERLKKILAGASPTHSSQLLTDMVQRGEFSTGGALTIREAVKGVGGAQFGCVTKAVRVSSAKSKDPRLRVGFVKANRSASEAAPAFIAERSCVHSTTCRSDPARGRSLAGARDRRPADQSVLRSHPSR